MAEMSEARRKMETEQSGLARLDVVDGGCLFGQRNQVGLASQGNPGSAPEGAVVLVFYEDRVPLLLQIPAYLPEKGRMFHLLCGRVESIRNPVELGVVGSKPGSPVTGAVPH
jgi:hypothetical protein